MQIGRTISPNGVSSLDLTIVDLMPAPRINWKVWVAIEPSRNRCQISILFQPLQLASIQAKGNMDETFGGIKELCTNSAMQRQ